MIRSVSYLILNFLYCNCSKIWTLFTSRSQSCCCVVVVLRLRYAAKVISGRSVKITTLFLGRLSPPKRLTVAGLGIDPGISGAWVRGAIDWAVRDPIGKSRYRLLLTAIAVLQVFKFYHIFFYFCMKKETYENDLQKQVFLWCMWVEQVDREECMAM